MGDQVYASLVNILRDVGQITITVQNYANTKSGALSIVVMISIGIMSANNKPATETQSSKGYDEFSDQLYNNLILADYRSAVAQTLKLENNYMGEVIEIVVDKLLAEGNRNILEFAYKLWNCGSEEIVIKYFPLQFQLILDNRAIRIINKRDNLALKLAIAGHYVGDRQCFGDGYDRTSIIVTWKMYPVWEKNRVYFKIRNIYQKQYLKLVIATDSEGDHKAFGADEEDSHRHQWYLQPIKYKKEILFYIYNRENDQVLKLSSTVDRYGHRMLWSHNDKTIESPALYGWKILPYEILHT